MIPVYDPRFARFFGICSYAPDDGDGGGDEGDGGTPPATDIASLKAEMEKWREMSRKMEAQAKSNAAAAKKLEEIENSNKSELEKLQAAREAAEKDASTARLELLKVQIATSKGLNLAQAKRLVGTTEEELEADADELLTTFKPVENDNSNRNVRPRESLRPGARPDVEPAVNVKEIVDGMVAQAR